MNKEKNGEDFTEEYVQINDIKQYFLYYKMNSDFIVLFLHGGITEAQLSYVTVLKERRYSFVYYDQRGTGKTQSISKSNADTITMEALVSDLDETINYIRKTYPNKKLILFGHSRGSILGIEYMKTYGSKVDAYVGMGQLVNFKAGLEMTMNHCTKIASDSDMKKLEDIQNDLVLNTPESLTKAGLALEQVQNKYKMAGYRNGNWGLLKIVKNSPVFVLSDLAPIMQVMKTNKNLFPCVGGCDFTSQTTFSVPMYFICGRNDWQAPGAVVEDYYKTLEAPQKGFYWIEDAGHFTNIDNPKACTNVLNEICSKL